MPGFTWPRHSSKPRLCRWPIRPKTSTARSAPLKLRSRTSDPAWSAGRCPALVKRRSRILHFVSKPIRNASIQIQIAIHSHRIHRTTSGCSKRFPSKAAANEAPRRDSLTHPPRARRGRLLSHGRYVEGPRDARTMLGTVFSILSYSSSSSSSISNASCRFCSSIALCRSMRTNIE